MIKFRAGSLIGLCITERNVELLKQGKPIFVDLREMGLEGEIIVIYGETESDISKQLAPFIDNETHIHADNNNSKH